MAKKIKRKKTYAEKKAIREERERKHEEHMQKVRASRGKTKGSLKTLLALAGALAVTE